MFLILHADNTLKPRELAHIFSFGLFCENMGHRIIWAGEETKFHINLGLKVEPKVETQRLSQLGVTINVVFKNWVHRPSYLRNFIEIDQTQNGEFYYTFKGESLTVTSFSCFDWEFVNFRLKHVLNDEKSFFLSEFESSHNPFQRPQQTCENSEVIQVTQNFPKKERYLILMSSENCFAEDPIIMHQACLAGSKIVLNSNQIKFKDFFEPLPDQLIKDSNKALNLETLKNIKDKFDKLVEMIEKNKPISEDYCESQTRTHPSELNLAAKEITLKDEVAAIKAQRQLFVSFWGINFILFFFKIPLLKSVLRKLSQSLFRVLTYLCN